MGSESERLVYDYLSKVGDAAQRAMTPRERVELVARVRDDLDARIGGGSSESAVRRTLARMGTPEDVVEAARGGDGAPAAPAKPRMPRAPKAARLPRTRRAPKPRPAPAAPAPEPEEPAEPVSAVGGDYDGGGPLVVDPAGKHGELGDDHLVGRPLDEDADGRRPTRAERARYPFADEGFDEDEDEDDRGAEEAPDDQDAEDDDREEAAAEPADAADTAPEPAERSGRDPLLGALAAAGGILGSVLRRPRELLGIALLLAGPITGFWPLLLAGWALLYFSPRLRPVERMTASLLVPGLTVAGGVAWLWARTTRRAGTPLPTKQVLHAAWALVPALCWTGAVVTVLFVVWRIAVGDGRRRNRDE